MSLTHRRTERTKHRITETKRKKKKKTNETRERVCVCSIRLGPCSARGNGFNTLRIDLQTDSERQTHKPIPRQTQKKHEEGHHVERQTNTQQSDNDTQHTRALLNDTSRCVIAGAVEIYSPREIAPRSLNRFDSTSTCSVFIVCVPDDQTHTHTDTFEQTAEQQAKANIKRTAKTS